MQPTLRAKFRRLTAGIASLLTAAAMTTGVSTAAFASTSLTVRVTHGGKYSATAPQILLLDHSVAAVACGTTKAEGALTNGTHTGTSPVQLGAISPRQLHNCDSPIGTGPITVTFRSLPYRVKADSATNKEGETDLIIPGINIRESESDCSFTISGSAAGYYVNATHKLHLTPKLPITPINKARLTLSHVNGCLGVWKDGDPMAIVATYKLSIPVKIIST